MIKMETEATIVAWADETFGPTSSNIRVAARANEEMAELLRALSADDNHPKAAAEIADVVIVLMRCARNLGTTVDAEVQRKMAINRGRIWNKDSTGHGYHVRAKPTAPADLPVAGE
jgi:NTP pyrophosphatase (non-canonical NTP hydrolase)